MTNEIAKAESNELQTMLGNATTLKRLRDALGSKTEVDYFVTSILKAAHDTPLILKCTKASVYGAIITAAQLKLTPNTPLGYAYLIPRKKRQGATETYVLTYQIGYRGMIELVNRATGAEVEAFEVYEGDEFTYELGTTPFIKHKPALSGDRSANGLNAVYAIATMPTGHKRFVVLPKTDLEYVYRQTVMATGASDPWNTWRGEQGKKTAIKRVCKYMPLTPTLALALDVDGKAEVGQPTYDLSVPEENPPTIADKYLGDLYLKLDTANSSDIEARDEIAGLLRKLASQPAIPGDVIEDLSKKFEAKYHVSPAGEIAANATPDVPTTQTQLL